MMNLNTLQAKLKIKALPRPGHYVEWSRVYDSQDQAGTVLATFEVSDEGKFEFSHGEKTGKGRMNAEGQVTMEMEG